MRTKHFVHSLPAFPVYSCAFVSPHELVLGGGGGQSKTGIKNKLRLYEVKSEDAIDLRNELELAAGEDVPMSMAANVEAKHIVCGVNSSLEFLKVGSNQNCRSYDVKESKISPLVTQSTLKLDNADDDFQKITVFSPDHTLLAVAGTKDLALLRYPSLEPVALPISLPKGEIYDATFSSSTLVVATTVNLLIYSLPPLSEEKKSPALPELELVNTIDRPSLPGSDAGSSFRCARFHPSDFKILYTVINTVAPKKARKNAPKRAYICKWDTETWKVKKYRKVSDRPLTCFDVSPSGMILAFGSSDYTVGVVDASTFAPVITILKAHEFPPTTLKFNPESKLLVSGSADNTIRIVSVPEYRGESWSSWIIVIVTLLIILFAIIAQQMHNS
ncbi:WD40 repeat-like protein [Cristinia sonorae]|uniref:WD40 repeat-like protein n=1 Tax=Cristinia sonorae TaxID=1940300 RepID=A0A8K0UWX2_9AGAR|nr:WD40 repeat-like protein [Cristinia sonorae]